MSAPRHDIPIPLAVKAKANPGQIKIIDTRDDRLEIAVLLKHLSPVRRVEYLRWACSQAVLPGTFGLHPAVDVSTYKLATEARHCDRADERLTMDCITTLTRMWIDFSLDAGKCLAKLVAMVRRKD